MKLTNDYPHKTVNIEKIEYNELQVVCGGETNVGIMDVSVTTTRPITTESMVNSAQGCYALGGAFLFITGMTLMKYVMKTIDCKKFEEHK